MGAVLRIRTTMGDDPPILLGLRFWCASDAPFTGNEDPKPNALIPQGVGVSRRSSGSPFRPLQS